jgi:hypothetical protein
MGPRRRRPALRLAIAATLALAACSGSNVTRSTGPITNTDDTIGADIPVRITASAVKPATLHLFNGLVATFVNEDAAARGVAVDAARSDQPGCAAVALVLQPGERKTTPALPRFAVCYFRDAQRPGDVAFQGVVVTH